MSISKLSSTETMAYLTGAIFFMVSTGIAVEYCAAEHPFNSAVLYLCAECCKFGISVKKYQDEVAAGKAPPVKVSIGYLRKNVMFGVPAFLYFTNNNMITTAYKYFPSHIIAVMSNFKIVMAALLATKYLNQNFNKRQWQAMCAIVVGIIVIQMDPGKKAGHDASEVSFVYKLFAVLFGLFTALQSAIAGVFCEFLYKGKESVNGQVSEASKESFHIQNAKLYAGGIIFNGLGAFLSMSTFKASDPYKFHILHLFLLFNCTFSGLLIGAIMKYLNNVIRQMTVAVALVSTTILSVFFLGNQLTTSFSVGASIVMVAIKVYNSGNSEPGVKKKTIEEEGHSKEILSSV